MPPKQKSVIENEDVFSEMSKLKTNSYRLPADPNKSETTSGALKNRTETGTRGYTVKKITTSHSVMPKTDTKSTRLGTVSIDTESKSKQNDMLHADQEITGTTIETGEFSQTTPSSNRKYPLIIDETDQPSESNEPNVLLPQIKKEKVQPPQNISLDISSEFFNPVIPTGNDNEQLGTGKVVGVLGSGGMARVYKIWNEKLEIYRAVKILLPTNQQETWDRFVTEAKITAKLHHPNIIETYDTGEWHGLPYIEMELIEGDTLTALISTHHLLPSPVCSAVALEIAKALSYAHSQQIQIYGKLYNGIIHRDLKPSNIMMTSGGAVKLMDFGVARPIETGLHTIATDSIVGTMHYFSPEQINGYPVDPLSDVYSFGTVLYEMLCGINPFPQNNMVNLIQAKTKNQFDRLEDFHLKIDHRLASVAQTCLRTDKRERFENFNALRKTLEEIHLSYNLGTPEEVISAFYKSPELIRSSFEQLYDSRPKQQEPEKVGLSGTSQVKEPVAVEKIQATAVHQESPREIPPSDLWEKNVKSHRMYVFVIATLLVIALIAGALLTGSKFLKKGAISQKYELLMDNFKSKMKKIDIK